MGDWVHRTTKAYLQSVSPDSLPDLISNYISQPDLSGVVGVPSKYWIITGDIISEMSPVEKDAVDAQNLSDSRDGIIQEQIDQLESVLRQVVIATVKEINILRQWIADLKTATASANNLNDFKAKIAALPDFTDRTLSQIKTQLRNNLGS